MAGRDDRKKSGSPLRCSFCERTHNEAGRIISGNGVFICEDCVRQCNEILENQSFSDDYSDVFGNNKPLMKPEQMKKKLDELDRQNNILDVIICLNDRTTESTIQCIVEKNLVGKTTVLGYYDSEPILKSIEKGSVYATFAVEANTIAKQCINTLNEYNDTGNVSNYMTAGFIKIDKTNVATYDPEGDRNEG